MRDLMLTSGSTSLTSVRGMDPCCGYIKGSQELPSKVPLVSGHEGQGQGATVLTEEMWIRGSLRLADWDLNLGVSII